MSNAFECPILESPGDERAVIDPIAIHAKSPRIPDTVVLSFFYDELEKMRNEGLVRTISKLTGEGPSIAIDVPVDNPNVAVVWPGLTAPFAACSLEELIAMGGRYFVCCGGAGALDGAIPAGHVVIPTSAVRHEGTSYHYQREGRESFPSEGACEVLAEACKAQGVPYLLGKTWTTDAVFRETPSMITRRREEGCLTVEMEAAALFAVAKYRNVRLGQYLYAGDHVGLDHWDHRNWTHLHSVRRALILLSIGAVRDLKLRAQP